MVHYPYLLRDHRASSDSLAVPNGPDDGPALTSLAAPDGLV